jgi:hypothetical protein
MSLQQGDTCGHLYLNSSYEHHDKGWMKGLPATVKLTKANKAITPHVVTLGQLYLASQ